MRISEMRRREQSLAELHEMLKTFTKSSLDKSSKVWYNIKVAARKLLRKYLENWTMHYKYKRPLKFKRASEKTIKNTNKSVSNWQDRYKQIYLCIYNFTKEFDPGSGRTLAARLTHASRTENIEACFDILSGGRVSNTWVTCLWEWDSFWKRMVIPHNIAKPHDFAIKVFRSEMASRLIR